MSSIYYQRVMLEENAASENYEFGEEGDELLSERMGRLDMKGLPVKSLASLQLPQSEETVSALDIPNPPTTPTKRRQLPPSSFTKSRKEQTSTLKQTRKTGQSPKRKENYNLEDGKMFQLREGRGGRQSMVSEVRNMRICEYSGRGLLVFPNGKKFEGEWVDGLLVGKAKISHPNGDVYTGDTYNFRRHGRGVLHYASGQKYEGEFSSGDFHGEGTLFDREGKIIYDGEWRRGKKYDR